jgi:hypothetical protein
MEYPHTHVFQTEIASPQFTDLLYTRNLITSDNRLNTITCHLGMEIAQGGQGHVSHQNIESEHRQFQQPVLHITRFLQCQKMHKSLVPFDNLLSFSKLPMDLFFMLALQAQICPVLLPNSPNHLHPILWH